MHRAIKAITGRQQWCTSSVRYETLGFTYIYIHIRRRYHSYWYVSLSNKFALAMHNCTYMIWTFIYTIMVCALHTRNICIYHCHIHKVFLCVSVSSVSCEWPVHVMYLPV